MLKTTSKILIASLLSQLLIPFSFSSAQSSQAKCEENPPVCSATPESMSLYLDFQREASALIQTNPFQTATETISKGEWGIFSNKLLELEGIKKFDDSLAGQALKVFYITSTRSAIALITSVYLFELSALSALSDNTISFSILLHERPIVRDWAKLLDIERNLNQTAYHLGKAGDIAKTIVQTAPIQALLKKYEEKGLLREADGFPTEIRYMDLIMTLASLNLTLKAFIAYGRVEPMRSFEQQGLKFNLQRIEQLNTDYRCTRWLFWFKCNRSRKSLTENLQKLTNNTNEQREWSKKIFKKSWNDLVMALGAFTKGARSNIRWKSSDSYLTEREKELLRDVYGLDTTKMTKDTALSIIHFSNRTKDQRKEVAKGTKTSEKMRETVGEKKSKKEKKAKETKNKKKKLATDIANSSPQKILNEIETENEILTSLGKQFNLTMVNALKNLNLSRLQAEQISAISTNLVLTHQFGQLSTDIKKMIDTVGNKQKNLRQTLDKICTYQCWNKGTENCYIH